MGPQILLGPLRSRARYTEVRVLGEVHLWGIQKGFMTEGTSEEVLKKNLRKKGAF